MIVAGLVRVLVVAAVMSRPPQRTLLRRRRAEQRQRELEDAAGLVALVREVAVVAAGDAEHAQPEGGEAERDQSPRERHEEREQAARVDAPVDDRGHQLVGGPPGLGLAE